VKNKIIFVSDFFKEDIVGGAEINDDTVATFFKNNELLHSKLHSHKLTPAFILENLDKHYFISNFVNLSTTSKALLFNKCSYVLYEHDYKFAKCRNPIFFADFKVPPHEMTNLNFFNKAKRLVCLSKLHKDIFELNTDIKNIENIKCSLFSDKQLELLAKLNKKEKTRSCAVIKSQDPRKRTHDAVQFCINNNLDYELISAKDNEEFFRILSEFKNLVFIAGHPEPTPRVIVEAKMLNINVISQKKLIGVAYEDWFKLNGDELIEEVRKMREDAFELFEKLIEN